MARRILPLTLDLFSEVPAPCRACLFWERDPVGHRRVDSSQSIGVKEAWISEVLREWGSCGRVAVVDGTPAGFVLYAPPVFVPRVASFPSGPVSADAVLMTTVWIDPRRAGGGIGRLLVQGMARDRVLRGEFRARVMPLTVPHDVVGIPSCALRAGFDENGLPVGIQIAAAPWRDEHVLAAAAAFHAATPEIQRRWP